MRYISCSNVLQLDATDPCGCRHFAHFAQGPRWNRPTPLPGTPVGIGQNLWIYRAISGLWLQLTYVHSYEFTHLIYALWLGKKRNKVTIHEVARGYHAGARVLTHGQAWKNDRTKDIAINCGELCSDFEVDQRFISGFPKKQTDWSMDSSLSHPQMPF